VRLPALLLLLAAIPAFADDEEIKVSQEKFPNSDIPTNVVEGVVNAPPAEVWAFVSSCANYSKTMPRIVKSAELSRAGDEKSLYTVKCQVTAGLPFPLSDLTGITQATHKVDPGVKYSREWTLVSGDYHINHGSWTLVGIDEGKKTQVTYKIRVQPKVNLPTSWMVSAQKSAIKDVILRMRENVKKPK
jgi:ribosome-associated toxin RatA of RatAB toxin-antitoxin module